MSSPALSFRIVDTIALASIVAASVVSCGDDESGDEATTMAPAETVTTTDGPTSSTTEQATTTNEPSTTVIEYDPAEAGDETAAAIPDWPPVLAGIAASSPPQPATCPTDGREPLTDLVPVPDFLELSVGPIEALAVFDPSSHSIVVVRRGAETYDGVSERETVAGRLDVCSGTWSPMNADFGTSPDGQAAWPNALVYDEDSAVLVAFAYDGVRVYDPLADEWLSGGGAMPDPAQWLVSAFYHPASGMIITDGGTMYAYDVDRAEWLAIGKNILSGFGEVLGINTDLDRLVVAEGVGIAASEKPENSNVTRLVDPVSGAYTDVPTPGRPVANVYNGWGADEAIGQIDSTVFVSHHAEGTICGFNSQTLTWDLCTDDPIIDVPPITHATWGGEWAIVGDPINNLLVAIPPTGMIRTAPLP